MLRGDGRMDALDRILNHMREKALSERDKGTGFAKPPHKSKISFSNTPLDWLSSNSDWLNKR